jgi:hypothetical protein
MFYEFISWVSSSLLGHKQPQCDSGKLLKHGNVVKNYWFYALLRKTLNFGVIPAILLRKSTLISVLFAEVLGLSAVSKEHPLPTLHHTRD